MSGRTFLLEDWVTVRSSLSNPFVQDPARWLDLEGFADATAWIDVTEVTPPGSANSVQLLLETAPSADDVYFSPMAPALTYGTASQFLQSGSTPTIVRSAKSTTSNNLMRYLRWKLVPSASGVWDMTFRVRVVANRSTVFVPPLIAGCQLWLRADIGITLNGSTVQQWNDQSGNGNSASQSTGASQPIYLPSAMNGFPAIQGNGSSAYMTTGSGFTLSNNVTICTAVQPLATQSAYNRIVEQQYSATYFLGCDSTGTAYKLIVDDAAPPYGAAQGGSVTANANTIVTGVYSSTTGKGTLYVNGTQVAQDTFTSPSTLSQPLYLMRTYNTAGQYWNGYFAEVAVYNRALATAELTRLHRYLGSRYGVTVP